VIEYRQDGSVVVWDKSRGTDQAVMVTPTSEGAILMTGSASIHPCDTVAALLNPEALGELVGVLTELGLA
jgi:hypothetical protein